MNSNDPSDDKQAEQGLSRRRFLELGAAAGVGAPVLMGANMTPETLKGAVPVPQERRWPQEKAQQWYADQDWIIGANFVPSTAVNMIEMWQGFSFDPETIDRELGYAEEAGFNTMRVYLHYLVWARDAKGYKERIEQYLEIADSHGIRTMFAMFDDVWGDEPYLGPQPEPVPGIHNSGWVENPGPRQRLQKELWPVFVGYTKDIISAFTDDERVLMWDLYNEPGNGKTPPESTLPLLKQIMQGAREVDPTQPLTVGTWNYSEAFSKLNEYQLAHSDIISFHSYGNLESTKDIVADLRAQTDRPLVCTEYMARTQDNTFENHLPFFHPENIGAVNWGLVSGKTQTIYPWPFPRGSSDEYFGKWRDRVRAVYPWEEHTVGPEPDPWFHDVFYEDGTPYDPDEVELIKKLSGQPAGSASGSP